ncbi:MAG: lipocalin family protein [Candidatus Aminicenantes bacterium]|jgi:apolipoprotein D and lipocalin family protein
MKIWLKMLIIPLMFFAGKESAAKSDPPKTVPFVDLNSYIGLWYEIAKIPNSFQKQCAAGTTAEYSLRDDGRIEVINKCFKSDGSLDEARGVARVVDTQTNAKLQVSFVRFLGRNRFWGDYWIIGLDTNYEWAVVGHPKRKYGWILSRTPVIGQEVRQKINALLESQGYDPKAFEDTPTKK